MMKVLADTNILVDVLAERQPFYEDSSAVWSLAEKSQIEGYISAISFNNIFCILRKVCTPAKTKKYLFLLRDIFQIAPLDQQILNQAMDSEYKDFEDAIQYFSALRIEAQCIISRNLKHYKDSEIAVLTPGKFLNSLSQ